MQHGRKTAAFIRSNWTLTASRTGISRCALAPLISLYDAPLSTSSIDPRFSWNMKYTSDIFHKWTGRILSVSGSFMVKNNFHFQKWYLYFTLKKLKQTNSFINYHYINNMMCVEAKWYLKYGQRCINYFDGWGDSYSEAVLFIKWIFCFQVMEDDDDDAYRPAGLDINSAISAVSYLMLCERSSVIIWLYIIHICIHIITYYTYIIHQTHSICDVCGGGVFGRARGRF